MVRVQYRRKRSPHNHHLAIRTLIESDPSPKPCVPRRACDVPPTSACHHVTATAVASISFPEVRLNFREKKKARRGGGILSMISARQKKKKKKLERFSRALDTQGILCQGHRLLSWYYCSTVIRRGCLILGPGAVLRHRCVRGRAGCLPHGVPSHIPHRTPASLFSVFVRGRGVARIPPMHDDDFPSDTPTPALFGRKNQLPWTLWYHISNGFSKWDTTVTICCGAVQRLWQCRASSAKSLIYRALLGTIFETRTYVVDN